MGNSALITSYGNCSFEEFNSRNIAFVDKTIFIKRLDELPTRFPILLRPRRFGKSTFVQMLKYFYDLALASSYEQVFKNTVIYNDDSVLHNSYHVIDFDFSGIYGETKEQIVKNFSNKVLAGIINFCYRYRNFKFSFNQELNDPAKLIQDFFNAYQFYNFEAEDPKNLFILIDEYDNFANELINSNRELFQEITGANGFVKAFYSNIKAATKTVVARTFITGVSSISLDSLTSGFNIAKNISTHETLSEFSGFTEQELEYYLTKTLSFPIDSKDLSNIIHKMKLAYNGYAFSTKQKHKLFNTSMCLNYVYMINQDQSILDPEATIDPACDFDLTRLHDLLENTDPQNLQLIIKNYTNDQSFSLSGLSEQINLNKIKQYSYNDALSILFYLGYLTIDLERSKAQDQGIVLVCPNKVIRNIFRQCFYNYYIAPERSNKLPNLDVECLIQEADQITPFISSLEQYLGARLSNQHWLRMSEQSLVAIITTKLQSDPNLLVKDEYSIQIPALGERFIDLFIKSKKSSAIYIFEFKYCSHTQSQREGALLEKLKQQAKEQLLEYRNAIEFKDLPKVYGYALIFEGAKCNAQRIF